MPLPGGAADKLGNQYEGLWTVRCLLDVLNGKATSLTPEAFGSFDEKAEFVLARDGFTERHQVKRQRASEGHWTLGSLRDSVLGPFSRAMSSDSSLRCVFASQDGYATMRELSERAAKAFDATALVDQWLTNDDLKKGWRELAAIPDLRDEAGRWDFLRRLTLTTIDHRSLATFVDSILAGYIDGDPKAARLVLADFAVEQLHEAILPEPLWNELKRRGFARRLVGEDPAVAQRVVELTDTFQRRATVTLLPGGRIHRQQAEDVIRRIDAGATRVWMGGAAGSGKTVSASELIDLARDRGYPVLALSVEDLTSGPHLADALALPRDPAVVLASLARVRSTRALLIIDKLDAVSDISSTKPDWFVPLRNEIDLATTLAFQVVVICRTFDLRQDERLKRMASNDEYVELQPLDREAIDGVLRDAGVNSPTLTGDEYRLLSVPLHLRLFVEVESPSSPGATLHGLFSAWWTTKERRVRSGQGNLATAARDVTSAMATAERLYCSERVLDMDSRSRDLLCSENVLQLDSGALRFTHDQLFDYAWVRTSLTPSTSIHQWLHTTAQGLFQRRQLRVALVDRRESAHPDYVDDLRALLTGPGVRHHMRVLTSAFLSDTRTPSQDEWNVVRPLALSADTHARRLGWRAVGNNSGWLVHMEVRDFWLRAFVDASCRGYAQDYLHGCAEGSPAAVVEVLQDIGRAHPALRGDLVRFVLGYGGATKLPLAPCELLAAWLRQGHADDSLHTALDWTFAYVDKHEPAWTIVVAALARTLELSNDPNPLSGEMRQAGREPMVNAARARPRIVAEGLMPMLSEVLRRGEDSVYGRMLHPTWAHLDQIIVAAIRTAIRVDASAIRTSPAWLELANIGSPTTVWLSLTMWAAVLESGRQEAPIARDFVVEHDLDDHPDGGRRDDVVLEVVARASRDPGVATSLETRALHRLREPIRPELGDVTDLSLRLVQHRRVYRRRAAWNRKVLEAIGDDHLTAHGHRILMELRRTTSLDAAAPTAAMPHGHPSLRTPRAYMVGSPIPLERAARLSDATWLRAMEVWAGGRRDGFPIEIGGADQLAAAFGQCAEKDPRRFANLALQMTPAVAEVYAQRVLGVLAGKADELDDSVLNRLFDHWKDAHAGRMARSLCTLVSARPGAQWTAEVKSTVLEWAAAHADDGQDMYDLPSDFHGSGDPDTAAVNSARPMACEATALLLAHDRITRPEAEGVLAAATRASVPVRAMAARIADVIMGLDRASDKDVLLPLLVTDVTALMRGHHVRQAVARAHHFNPGPYRAVLEQCAGTEGQAALASGIGLALDWLSHPEDVDVTARCERLVTSPTSMARRGVAEVLSANVEHWPTTPSPVEWLTRLLNDPDAGVRRGASQFIERNDENSEPTTDLVALLIRSTAFADVADEVADFVCSRPRVDVEEVLRCVTRTRTELESGASHRGATGLYLAKDKLVAAVLRGLEQVGPGDSAARGHLLDALDELAALDAQSVDRTIAERNV